MRFVLIGFLCLPLAACVAPSPQAQAPQNQTAAFVAPMDPGQIRCAELANPSALRDASAWTMGQLRARVMAGTLGQLPSEAEVATRLQSACATAPSGTISSVLSQLA